MLKSPYSTWINLVHMYKNQNRTGKFQSRLPIIAQMVDWWRSENSKIVIQIFNFWISDVVSNERGIAIYFDYTRAPDTACLML